MRDMDLGAVFAGVPRVGVVARKADRIDPRLAPLPRPVRPTVPNGRPRASASVVPQVDQVRFTDVPVGRGAGNGFGSHDRRVAGGARPGQPVGEAVEQAGVEGVAGAGRVRGSRRPSRAGEVFSRADAKAAVGTEFGDHMASGEFVQCLRRGPGIFDAGDDRQFPRVRQKDVHEWQQGLQRGQGVGPPAVGVRPGSKRVRPPEALTWRSICSVGGPCSAGVVK